MKLTFSTTDYHIAAFNIERNISWLKNVLWEQYLDLAIVPYIKQEGGIIPIQQDLLEKLGETKENIFNKAKYNTFHPDNVNMLSSNDLEKIPETEFEIYMITNKDYTYGAAMIANKILMETFADVIIGSDFWVIPSSVNECIIVPYSDNMDDGNEILKVVYEVNQSIPNELFLSNSIYYYDKERKELKKYETAW